MQKKRTFWDKLCDHWYMRVRYYIRTRHGMLEVSRKQWEDNGALDALDKIRETAVLLHIMLPK